MMDADKARESSSLLVCPGLLIPWRVAMSMYDPMQSTVQPCLVEMTHFP